MLLLVVLILLIGAGLKVLVVFRSSTIRCSVFLFSFFRIIIYLVCACVHVCMCNSENGVESL